MPGSAVAAPTAGLAKGFPFASGPCSAMLQCASQRAGRRLYQLATRYCKSSRHSARLPVRRDSCSRCADAGVSAVHRRGRSTSLHRHTGNDRRTWRASGRRRARRCSDRERRTESSICPGGVDAILVMERVVTLLPESTLARGTLGNKFAMAGKRERAIETVRLARVATRGGYVSPKSIADVYVGLRDARMAWLTRAFEEREGFLVSVFTDRCYAGCRGGPAVRCTVPQDELRPIVAKCAIIAALPT